MKSAEFESQSVDIREIMLKEIAARLVAIRFSEGEALKQASKMVGIVHDSAALILKDQNIDPIAASAQEWASAINRAAEVEMQSYFAALEQRMESASAGRNSTPTETIH